MVINCSVCNRRVLRHSRILTCSICSCLFHSKCLYAVDGDISGLNWFCIRCTADIFPFNHYAEDDLFLSCLSEMWFKHGNFPFSHLQNIVFNPFELNDSDTSSPLFDIDPDIQYFNEVTSLNNFTQCDYYVEDTFLRMYQSDIKCAFPFSLIHVNIRSIPKHFDEWELYLQSLGHHFSIVGVTETWLNDQNVTNYDLSGYQHVYKCRSDQRGGGVSLFVIDRISFHERRDLDINSNVMESVFVEIGKESLGRPRNTIIGLVYRPPNTDINIFNEQISEVLDRIKSEKKQVYLLGDFNINLLDANSHVPIAEFLDTLFSNFIFPSITKPTRVTKTSCTLIDNIFHNDMNQSGMIKGVLFTEISDHFPVFLICPDELLDVEPKINGTRDYCQTNIERFRSKLGALNWSLIFDEKDGEEAFNGFHTAFLEIYEKSFPYRKKPTNYKGRKPWLSLALRNSIKHKNKLYVRYLRNPTQENIEIYKVYKRNLQRLLRLSERKYYEEFIHDNKNNVKKLWGIIKQVINKGKNSSKSVNFNVGGKVINDSYEISNGFNKYFANIAKDLARKIPKSSVDPLKFIPESNLHTIAIDPVTENEVSNVIKSLKNSSSTGYDGIQTEVIKSTFHAYLTPLTQVLNASLIQGFFPDKLKISKVVPLLKSGNPASFNNYRPVSVLPLFSKILEKLMHNRLMSFIDKHDILYQFQFGFRQHHGTNMTLITLVDKILSAIDNGDIVVGIFLDFKKAFDTVNHDILLRKLERYGIRGIAHNWIKDYLNKRQQFVCYNGSISSRTYVDIGVPQGSVLGPLLFLIYINDLANVSNNVFPVMFADDTNIFLRGREVNKTVKIMNTELTEIVVWLSANAISLNVEKTKYMIFRSLRKRIDQTEKLLIKGNVVERVSSIKFLGVMLDQTLSWNLHIQMVKNKLAKSIGILKLANKTLPKAIIKSLYFSFIYPHLVYCVEVWGNAADVHVSQLLKMQKRCIRLIKSVPPRTESAPLFKELGILKIHDIYRLYTMCFMFKFIKNLLPGIFDTMFTKNINIALRQTRQIHKLQVPRMKSTLYMKSLKYQGVIEWNNISEKIEHNCSYHSFKHSAKTFLLQMKSYSS